MSDHSPQCPVNSLLLLKPPIQGNQEHSLYPIVIDIYKILELLDVAA